MKSPKILFFVLVFVLLSVVGFSALAGEKPFSGTTITIITTSSGPVKAIEKNIGQFEELTGIKVNFEIYEFQEAINKININAAGGGKGVDVICYRPIQETSSWYKNGYFKVLNDYIQASGDEYDYQDFFPSAREVTTIDGNIVGIPYLVEGEILWYNKELFEKYDVEVPTTFDELMQAAEKLNHPDENEYGIALRGEGNGAVTQFSGFLYGFGGNFFDKDRKATMNTPEALAALEYYANLTKFGPEGMAATGNTEAINWFNAGLTAMRIDAYAQTFNHTDPERSTIHEKLGYAMLPMGPVGRYTPYNIVAWSWGISSTSEKQDAAWEFIKWATSKEMEVQGMLEQGWSARGSAWADPRIEIALNPELMAVVKKTGEVGLPYDRPNNMNASEVRAIVGKMIDLAHSGLRGEELAKAVEPLNQNIQAILDSEK